MALLALKTRIAYFKKLGLGEYNADNIKRLQKKYMRPADADGIYGTNTDRLLRHVYNCSLVPDFKPEEFRCPCGHCTGFPTRMKQVELKHLQTIRDHFDKPMIITSGLRCKYENQRVGGVPNSGHLTGYAADFYMAGVTDSVSERNKALKYIKTLPDHKFTYGAHMVDSDGVYREAPGMGNAMHTECRKSSPSQITVTDKLLTACKEQAEWMQNSKYKWENKPTVEKSKKFGTCVTYVACVLQRLGYLAPGACIWHNSKGTVSGATDRMTVIYPKGSLQSIRSQLKAGDIIMDGDRSDQGSGSHIFILTGKWDGNAPVVWDNHSAQQKKGAYTYKRNRNVIAIVRLK